MRMLTRPDKTSCGKRRVAVTPANWEVQALTFAMRTCVTWIFLTFLLRRPQHQIFMWNNLKWKKIYAGQQNRSVSEMWCPCCKPQVTGELKQCLFLHWRSQVLSLVVSPAAGSDPPVSKPLTTYIFHLVSCWHGLPSIFSYRFLLSCLLSLTRL